MTYRICREYNRQNLPNIRYNVKVMTALKPVTYLMLTTTKTNLASCKLNPLN